MAGPFGWDDMDNVIKTALEASDECEEAESENRKTTIPAWANNGTNRTSKSECKKAALALLSEAP